MSGSWRRIIASLLVAGFATLVRWASGGRARRQAHRTETVFGYNAARHKIRIVGAGFGGTAAALRLDARLGRRPDVSVLVIARDSTLLFTPLL